MPAGQLKKLASLAAGTILAAFGEPFLITDVRDGSTQSVTGVFDEAVSEAVTAQVTVLLDKPNVFFIDDDTNGRLNRQYHTIKRILKSETYKITDLLRDETASTRYILDKTSDD